MKPEELGQNDIVLLSDIFGELHMCRIAFKGINDKKKSVFVFRFLNGDFYGMVLIRSFTDGQETPVVHITKKGGKENGESKPLYPKV